MKLTDQSYTITRWDPEVDIREMYEAATICYQSESKADPKKLLNRIRHMDPKHPHTSPFEHSILSATFTTNRGITHELVRHRLMSPNQESTRYCNYDSGRFTNNVWFIEDTSIPEPSKKGWLQDCVDCEAKYFRRLSEGLSTDQARGALNNDVRAKIKITANYIEWYHIFNLRCDDKHAHYQMVELMKPFFLEVYNELPFIFDGIEM